MKMFFRKVTVSGYSRNKGKGRKSGVSKETFNRRLK
jgi:hypothetical protein